MSVSVKLSLTRLRRVIKGERAALDRASKAYAEAVSDLAQQLAPVDTGELRASIHVEAGDVQGSHKVVASVPYAVFVEFGTHTAAAQPFLTPAWRHTNPLPFFARELAELIK
jgi:phage protein, HK97 gp10 family